MKDLWTVTVRELSDWRAIPWISGGLLVLIMALPFLPGFAHHDGGEVRSAASAAVAHLWALILGCICGFSLLANRRRLGFLFAQPLSVGQIWFGKVLAAAVVMYASSVVLQLPAFLEGHRWLLVSSLDGVRFEGTPIAVWCGYLLAPLLVMLLVHVVGNGVRNRSPWVLLDALGATISALLIATSVVGFRRYFATPELVSAAAVWISVVTVGWLLAGWLQLRQGRTDVRRGHMALSAVGWTMTVAASFGLLVSSERVQGGSIEDLRAYMVEPARSGPWISVVGPNGRRLLGSSAFLYNTDTKASLRAVPVVRGEAPIVLTETGDVAYGIVSDAFQPNRIVSWSLTDRAIEQPLPLMEFKRPPRMAAATGWLAVASGRQLQLFRVEPWQRIGSAELPARLTNWSMSVSSDGVVRIFGHRGQELLVVDFDGTELEERVRWRLSDETPSQVFEPGHRAVRVTREGIRYRIAPDEEPIIRELGSFHELFLPHWTEFQGAEILMVPHGKSESQLVISRPDVAEDRLVTLRGAPVTLAESNSGDMVVMTRNENETFVHRVRVASDEIEVEEIVRYSGWLKPRGSLAHGFCWAPEGLVRIDFETGGLKQILTPTPLKYSFHAPGPPAHLKGPTRR